MARGVRAAGRGRRRVQRWWDEWFPSGLFWPRRKELDEETDGAKELELVRLLGMYHPVLAGRQHGLAEGLEDPVQNLSFDDMDQRPRAGLGPMLLLQGGGKGLLIECGRPAIGDEPRRQVAGCMRFASIGHLRPTIEIAER